MWMINMRETTKTKTNMRCLFLLTIMGIFFYNKKSYDFQYKRKMIFNSHRHSGLISAHTTHLYSKLKQVSKL